MHVIQGLADAQRMTWDMGDSKKKKTWSEKAAASEYADVIVFDKACGDLPS